MKGRQLSDGSVVNALVTSLRSRVCSGGSVASMCVATAGCSRRRDSLPAKNTAVSFESRASPSASRASTAPAARAASLPFTWVTATSAPSRASRSAVAAPKSAHARVESLWRKLTPRKFIGRDGKIS